MTRQFVRKRKPRTAKKQLAAEPRKGKFFTDDTALFPCWYCKKSFRVQGERNEHELTHQLPVIPSK